MIILLLLVLLVLKCGLDASYHNTRSPAFWINIVLAAAFAALLVLRVS